MISEVCVIRTCPTNIHSIVSGYGAVDFFNFQKCTSVNHSYMVGELEQALFIPPNDS
jgi:hypothetical protein